MRLVYPEGVYEAHLISPQTGELILATGAHSPQALAGFAYHTLPSPLGLKRWLSSEYVSFRTVE